MDDKILLQAIANLEIENQRIQVARNSEESRLDKRALAIALTHLETAMLWLANSRPD